MTGSNSPIVPFVQLRRAARAALSAYRLTDAKLTLLRWRRSLIYRVDASRGRRFVLRLQDPAVLDDEWSEVQLRWLRAIRCEMAMPVAQPVATRRGELNTRVLLTSAISDATPRRAVLLTWTPGRTMHGTNFLRPANLRTIGRTAALLHANAAALPRTALRG